MKSELLGAWLSWNSGLGSVDFMKFKLLVCWMSRKLGIGAPGQIGNIYVKQNIENRGSGRGPDTYTNIAPNTAAGVKKETTHSLPGTFVSSMFLFILEAYTILWSRPLAAPKRVLLTNPDLTDQQVLHLPKYFTCRSIVWIRLSWGFLALKPGLDVPVYTGKGCLPRTGISDSR